jgi:histidinol-phosphate aminotransferase
VRAHAENLALYPDNSGHDLVRRLSVLWGFPAEHFALGAGSNELFYLLCDLFAERGREVVIGEYGFISYRIASLLAGATPVATPMPGLRHDLDAMREAVTDQTRLLFLPNPNNPTGTALPRKEIKAFARSLPDHVVLCLDEAYTEYEKNTELEGLEELVREGRPVVLTRTFSKIHGLAGLRIGYGLTTPDLASLLNRVRSPFNTGTLAQAAAVAALDDEDWIRYSRETNRAARLQLEDGLRSLGFSVLSEAANFLLLSTRQAAAIASRLQDRGLITRPLGGYGLPHHLRITIGSPEQNDRLLQALQDLAPSLPSSSKSVPSS